ncbi:hypothetical protein P10VF_228 [Rhizobium phage vB_RleM_P10VF]|uniref:Uncharacterized protein n=1 Tax=Rhizobium phage vB_RleM_P10VF TaxID=1527770 RepID=A0A076YQF0_9CAUD|nr:hypothetical protein P10VF_228 [Rhizobium phage vB_RleM_P10VF]AIK68441.1 hypothetical protein P10VF_228 [Rhizobium phage vB_RleM_P10VF]
MMPDWLALIFMFLIIVVPVAIEQCVYDGRPGGTSAGALGLGVVLIATLLTHFCFMYFGG